MTQKAEVKLQLLKDNEENELEIKLDTSRDQDENISVYLDGKFLGNMSALDFHVKIKPFKKLLKFLLS